MKAGAIPPPYLAVALLSAATFAFELLLVRLTALIHWHHFAALAISVALLGFGAAGVFVALARSRLLAVYPLSFATAAGLFALCAVLACWAVSRAPFNALELAWSFAAWAGLIVLYLSFALPFFCAATALCLAYAAHREHVGPLYGADLSGAAASVLVLFSLHLLPVAEAIRISIFLALLAAAVSMGRGGMGLFLALAAALSVPSAWLAPTLSPYKELAQALAVADAYVIGKRQGPLGQLVAVASPQAPLRHAPGLSVLARELPPEQIGVYLDGHAAGAINHFDGDFSALAYFDAMPSALPYRLLEQPRVLIVGAGAGSDVLQAKRLGAREIVAVEADANIVSLVEEDLAAFSGRPYSLPGVRLALAEARGYLARSQERFDLIQLAMLEGASASLAGLGATQENYLYTLEAFAAYLDHLEPGGLLAITRWLSLPPRDALRLAATARAALERRGEEASMALMLLRSLNTTTLIVKNGAFSPREIEIARDFADAYAFDLSYYPGITPTQANRYNLLDHDEFYAGLAALVGDERERFLRESPFRLSPTTDDAPYFSHFFRWQSLIEFWRLRREGALPPLEWGYPVLLLALVQALVASGALILAPLALSSSRLAFATLADRGRWQIPAYFSLLGFAFMAVEIPLLAKLTLLLAHPAYAAAVALASLLVCAGLGAYASARLPAAHRLFLLLPLLLVGYAVVLEPACKSALAWPFAARALLALALIAPVAFCMGLAFPLGLAWLSRHAPALIPWAWGINGFASVVASLAAALLAIHGGQRFVMLMAAAAYGAAAALFLHLRKRECASNLFGDHDDRSAGTFGRA
ncbi:MAG: hypothetical protein N2441_06115 [Rhodocyclaceae bacterium]|nr:hypothetical protein [Rhodocyclaceae bacterium]